MKYRISLIMLCLILVLSVVGNVIVYAITDERSVNRSSELTIDTEAEAVKTGDKFIRKDIVKQKQIKSDNNTDTAIYEDSVKYGENRVYDNYMSDTYRYTFDRNGKLVGCHNKTALNDPELVKGLKETVSEKQAVSIAQQFISSEFKNAADDYELTYSYYNESMKIFFFVFSKVYNGFISADSISVNVSAIGEIVLWNATWCGAYDDFDASLLKDLERKDIDKYVEEQVLPTMNNVINYEIKNISLKKLNSEYVIELSIETEYTDSLGEVLASRNTWYYEI